MGPLIFGIVSNKYNLRYSTIYIVITVLIGIILVYNINYKNGIKQAGFTDSEIRINRAKSIDNTGVIRTLAVQTSVGFVGTGNLSANSTDMEMVNNNDLSTSTSNVEI